MCNYITMLAERLLALLEVMVKSRQLTVERSAAMEDDVGAVQKELGDGAGLPGGPYVNVWSGLYDALDNSQTVANLVGKIAQQVRTKAAAMTQITSRDNKASADVVGVRAQITGLEAKQRMDTNKVTQIGSQLLTSLLGKTQQEHQSHIASCGGEWEAPDPGNSRVNEILVEDAVVQVQLELQMVQSRLRSDAASVAGHPFEYYEDTVKWVVTIRDGHTIFW
jgi:hypothetical protein